MRILTVSNVPLEPHLGSGYVISGYVEGLRSAGHDVTTLEPRDYEMLPSLRAAKRLRLLVGYSRATLRASCKGRFDLVELWGAESWWSARRLAQRPSRPLLVGRSNGLETLMRHTLKREGLLPNATFAARVFDAWQTPQAAFRQVDALTTVSSQDRDFAVAREYQPPERIVALENPLADEWLDQPIVGDRQPILGFFGSWLPRKGVTLLPSVFTSVLRHEPGWRARLVGVGGLDRLALFPADVAERVEVIPFVTDRVRVRALYQDTAIVVMPSLYESFGLVAAESMSSGCALIASPTGFAAALTAGEEAVIVHERTASAWTQAILGLIANDASRRRVAHAGYCRVQALRWKPAVSRLLDLYNTLRPARSAT